MEQKRTIAILWQTHYFRKTWQRWTTKKSFKQRCLRRHWVQIQPHPNHWGLLLFSRSVMSDSLPPHRLQHARLPCLHYFPEFAQVISIELVMLSNHLILCRPPFFLSSFFPSIRVFSNESTLRISSQSIGASISESILPMNIQNWFPLGRTGLNSLLPKGLSRVFSSTTIQNHRFFGTQPSWW